MNEVILYSSHCPKCMMVESIMNNKGISFRIEDNEDVYMAIADKNHIRSMPFADVGGKILNTMQLQDYLINR